MSLSAETMGETEAGCTIIAEGIKTTKENVQVRYTGDWSSNSKLSSIASGYWEDPFLSFFNKVDPVPRRTSLICRGYYVRFRVCDFFMRSILEATEEPIQIVSVGCGMDTTFFRIFPQFESKVAKFFDLDFESVIEMKKTIIAENEILHVMQNDRLSLVSVDLRCTDGLRGALEASGFNFEATTLFYSECVVNYLLPNESERILQWIVANVPNSIWLAYEQCNYSDSFGKVMVKHFETNGCPLLSLPSTPDMDSQKRQLQSAGFQNYQVFNAWDAFLYLTRNEEYSFPRVIGKKQQFDEHEALLATCLHYSVRIAKTGYGSDAIAHFLHETDNAISSMLKPPQPSVSLIGEDLSALVLCNLDKKFTGHTTLRSQHSMLVFGGTGENSQRCTALQEVTVSSESNENRVETKCVKDDWRLFERVYSSAVFHQRTNSFYIFGGRKSPQTLCDSDLVQISTKPPYVVKTLSFQDSECPGGRWRSSMIVVANDLLLFGGKTDKEVLGDCWRFEFALGRWRQIKSVDLPTPRHSHSMCWDAEKNQAYCIGGLSKNESELCQDAVCLCDLSTFTDGKWVNLPDLSAYGRRIGHSCVIVNRTLCIVGGYGANSSYNLSHFVTLVSLDNNGVRALGLDPSITFLPFGFSITVEPGGDGSAVLTIHSGGGNCFSFGTHLNTFLLELKINDV